MTQAALASSSKFQQHKKIKLQDTCERTALKLSEEHGLRLTTARILAARGFTCDDKSLNSYLEPSLGKGLPHPRELKNLDQAVDLLAETINKKEKIGICCDFDVDGLTGGSQLASFLHILGIPFYLGVPNRFSEGYGLNTRMIDEAAEGGCSVLVAIDYGTTNRSELLRAQEHGLRTIVIDHHHVGEDHQPVDIFINPQQSDCGFANGILSAAGLVWYLIIGLITKLEKKSSINPKEFLDLAGMGTICDMVPLLGVNRIIAKRGIEALSASTKPGIQALKTVAGVKASATTRDVGFGLGPRINAAGRIDHGELVIQLFTTSCEKEAKKIAKKLDTLNSERQREEAVVKEQVFQYIEALPELPSGIVAWGEDFHTGVIGIVAQRLVERFYRPSAVMGTDNNGVYKGSVRTISGISVIDLLSSCSDLLVKFGGHKGAGGFAVTQENVAAFSAKFNEECKKRITQDNAFPIVKADAVSSINEITFSLIDELKRLEPFGMGNPTPVIVTKELSIVDIKVLKQQHLKIKFSDPAGNILQGLMWRVSEHPSVYPGNKVNLAFKPEKNEWGTMVNIQANIQAIEDHR